MLFGNDWGYVFDNNWKLVEFVIWILVEVVVKGGNLLLGVGFKLDGIFLEIVE